jgi:hypothetical protein
MKRDKIDGTCNTHEGGENFNHYFIRGVRVGGRTKLKWLLKKYDMRMWSLFIWLRMMLGSCGHINGTYLSTQDRIYCLCVTTASEEKLLYLCIMRSVLTEHGCRVRWLTGAPQSTVPRPALNSINLWPCWESSLLRAFRNTCSVQSYNSWVE